MKVLFNNAEPLIGRRLFVDINGKALPAALTMISPSGVTMQMAGDRDEVSIVTEADYVGEDESILAFFARGKDDIGYEAFFDVSDVYTAQLSELHKTAKKIINESNLEIADTASDSLDWLWQNYCNMTILDAKDGLVEVDEISNLCKPLLEDLLYEIVDPNTHTKAMLAIPMIVRTSNAEMSSDTRLFLRTSDGKLASAYLTPFKTGIKTVEGQHAAGEVTAQSCLALLEQCPEDITVLSLMVTASSTSARGSKISMTVSKYDTNATSGNWILATPESESNETNNINGE